MRRPVDRERVLRFMRELGRLSDSAARIYLAGGASAVLLEWRESTIDIDLELRPESIKILKVLPSLKEDLEINVELASPGHFLPELAGWQERSRFIVREGVIDFFHYDFYAQALSKIERSHARDLLDVRAMSERGLIEPARMIEFLASIEPELYRYPAIDPPTLRAAVERFVRENSR